MIHVKSIEPCIHPSKCLQITFYTNQRDWSTLFTCIEEKITIHSREEKNIHLVELCNVWKPINDNRTEKYETLKTRITQSFKAQCFNAHTSCSNISLTCFQFVQWLSNLSTKCCKLLQGNCKKSRPSVDLKKSWSLDIHCDTLLLLYIDDGPQNPKQNSQCSDIHDLVTMKHFQLNYKSDRQEKRILGK
jgi:hypothetical protein